MTRGLIVMMVMLMVMIVAATGPTEPSTTLAAKDEGKLIQENTVVLTWDSVEEGTTDEANGGKVSQVEEREEERRNEEEKKNYDVREKSDGGDDEESREEWSEEWSEEGGEGGDDEESREEGSEEGGEGGDDEESREEWSEEGGEGLVTEAEEKVLDEGNEVRDKDHYEEWSEEGGEGGDDEESREEGSEEGGEGLVIEAEEKVLDEGNEVRDKDHYEEGSEEGGEGGDDEESREEGSEEGGEGLVTEAEEKVIDEGNEVRDKDHYEEGSEEGRGRQPDEGAEEIPRKHPELNNKKNDKTKDGKRTEQNGEERKKTDEAAEENAEGDDEDDNGDTEETHDALRTTRHEDEGGRRRIKTSTEGGGVGGAAGVKAYLVVGRQKGWRPGRVEEAQLRRSAALFNYVYRSEEAVPRCASGEQDDSLLIFLPRAEGVVQAAAGAVAAGLAESGASILLSHHHPGSPGTQVALVGWTRQVLEAARKAKVTSLAALAQHLQESDALRRKCRAKVDKGDRVFHVLRGGRVDDGALDVVEDGYRYKVEVQGRVPPLLLATPSSTHARALLLALSDYLTGTLHPQHGCISCIEASDAKPIKPQKKLTKEVVVVGVFVEKPHPFLGITLDAFLNCQLPARSTHIYIYNQVQEYEAEVMQFAEELRQAGVRHVTLGELVPDASAMARQKNELLEECKLLGCSWFLHWSTTAFLNPGVPSRLLHLSKHLLHHHHHHHHHKPPVLAPFLRVQRREEANFWRGIKKHEWTPAHSWDHTDIMSEKDSVRNHWHATCLTEFYIIPEAVLAELSNPYTHPFHLNSSLALCAALREAGVPMVVTTALQHIGVLVNSTGYTLGDSDVALFMTNPDLWGFTYLATAWRDIRGGNLSAVSRPCDEVYQFPTFNDRFCIDLLRLAYSRNEWSPALRQDPRRAAPGIESVPTVDQWMSDLGLSDMLDALFQNILRTQLMISFPHSDKDIVVASHIARFRPQELPGLPSHHDASAVTFHVLLSPSFMYQGGELEFPRQGCRVKADAGEVLVFPGRLTHPKALHNVTQGELHKLVIHIDMYKVRIKYSAS